MGRTNMAVENRYSGRGPESVENYSAAVEMCEMYDEKMEELEQRKVSMEEIAAMATEIDCNEGAANMDIVDHPAGDQIVVTATVDRIRDATDDLLKDDRVIDRSIEMIDASSDDERDDTWYCYKIEVTLEP